jgi:hypothetical protein
MTAVPSYAFHPAPAAPAPAPSQIRFPRLPHRIHQTDLPLPGSPRAKMVLLRASLQEPDLEHPEQFRKEFPTWLH